VLTPDEASQLLTEYGNGAAWTQHCIAVADAAVKVGARLGPRRAVDLDFLRSAALLHDIGRYVTHDPVRHGVEGYALLTKLGHEEEAHVCASHILFGLDAAEAERFGLPARDFLPRSTEERLVPLVDYLIETDVPTTLDLRFSSLRERNAENPFFLSRLERAYHSAGSFMAEIDGLIGDPVEAIVASVATAARLNQVGDEPGERP